MKPFPLLTAFLLRLTPLACALAFAAQLPAQTPMPGELPPTNPSDLPSDAVARADRDFLEDASTNGWLAADVARVAVERSTNAQVRNYAQGLLNHHVSANTELATLATTRGVRLPAKDRKPTEEWMKKEAKEFDADFLEEMENVHEDVVDLFKDATGSKDAEIAAFAQKHLPTLQAQLMQAKNLRDMVK